jgi:hypothetical protein
MTIIDDNYWGGKRVGEGLSLSDAGSYSRCTGLLPGRLQPRASRPQPSTGSNGNNLDVYGKVIFYHSSKARVVKSAVAAALAQVFGPLAPARDLDTVMTEYNDRQHFVSEGSPGIRAECQIHRNPSSPK